VRRAAARTGDEHRLPLARARGRDRSRVGSASARPDPRAGRGRAGGLGGRADSIPLSGDRVTSLCTDLFNVSYEILLQILERYFAHTEEADAQLGTLANAAVTLMGGVLRPLGDLITTLPVGPEHP